MNDPENLRPLEQGIQLDLRDRVSYGGYLQLDTLLSAQRPLTSPPHHDEMLFIVQHQVSELWMKLIIHELREAIARLRVDDVDTTLKVLARVKQVQRQLFEQWGVLETLTPSEYSEFRPVLGASSGFQSPQYRLLEFKLGNKDRSALSRFSHHLEYYRQLKHALESPSLYDEFLRYLARRGHAVPKEILDRDVTQAHARAQGLVPVFKNIYKMSHRERRHLRIDELPGNLSEALDELEKSDLMRETLGDHIFDHFLAAKRAEWDGYIRHVSAWEVERYLNTY